MKKMMIMVVVVGGLTAFTACKKDHNCSCTTDSTVTGFATVSVTWDTTLVDMTKGDAKTTCTGLDYSVNTGGSSVTQTCALK